MAKIEVTMTENEIREACKYWATTRILNEGEAISAELEFSCDTTNQEAKIDNIGVSIRVGVVTKRMMKNAAVHQSFGPFAKLDDTEVPE